MGEKYPGLKKAEVTYNGSGDSFEGFWDMNFEFTGPNQKKMNEAKYSATFMENAEDILHHALDNSEANFNDEGSEGTIYINFENGTMSIDNYYFTTQSYPSGTREFTGEEEYVEQ